MEKLYHLLAINNSISNKSEEHRIMKLATTVTDTTASQWAIIVGEVHRDQSGSDYVEVAFKLPDGQVESRDIRLRGSGELARSRLSTHLLDQLRRKLK